MRDDVSHPRRRQKLPVLYDVDQTPLRAIVQLLRTYQRIERTLETVVARHGISMAQFDVLMTLSLEEGITQQLLAERLLVTKGNVCALLDRLESGGFVRRRPDPEDRRANRLYLTRAGRGLLDQSAPDHHRAVREIVSALSPNQQQALCQLLDKLEG
jgi:DNA-binding MarR family transcriptional regulator